MPNIAVCRFCIYEMETASTGKPLIELINRYGIIILLGLAVPDFIHLSTFEEIDIALGILIVYLRLRKFNPCEFNNRFSFVNLGSSHCSLNLIIYKRCQS